MCGHRTKALIDTGSTVTIVSRQLAEKLKLPIDTRATIRAETIGGYIYSSGRLSLNITIGRITQTLETHVFDNFGYDLLISVTDAGKFRLVLDFANRQFLQKINGIEEPLHFTHDSKQKSTTGPSITHMSTTTLASPTAETHSPTLSVTHSPTESVSHTSQKAVTHNGSNTSPHTGSHTGSQTGSHSGSQTRSIDTYSSEHRKGLNTGTNPRHQIPKTTTSHSSRLKSYYLRERSVPTIHYILQRNPQNRCRRQSIPSGPDLKAGE